MCPAQPRNKATRMRCARRPSSSARLITALTIITTRTKEWIMTSHTRRPRLPSSSRLTSRKVIPARPLMKCTSNCITLYHYRWMHQCSFYAKTRTVLSSWRAVCFATSSALNHKSRSRTVATPQNVISRSKTAAFFAVISKATFQPQPR